MKSLFVAATLFFTGTALAQPISGECLVINKGQIISNSSFSVSEEELKQVIFEDEELSYTAHLVLGPSDAPQFRYLSFHVDSLGVVQSFAISLDTAWNNEVQVIGFEGNVLICRPVSSKF